MTEEIPGLLGYVTRVLKASPTLPSKVIYERSQARYPQVADMTVQQFHARYPLRVKRALGLRPTRLTPLPESGALNGSGWRPVEETGRRDDEPGAVAEVRAAPTRSAGRESRGVPAGREIRDAGATRDSIREALRTLFLRLALDLETAGDRDELVAVVGKLDDYVDEAMAVCDGDGPAPSAGLPSPGA